MTHSVSGWAVRMLLAVSLATARQQLTMPRVESIDLLSAWLAWDSSDELLTGGSTCDQLNLYQRKRDR